MIWLVTIIGALLLGVGAGAIAWSVWPDDDDNRPAGIWAGTTCLALAAAILYSYTHG